MLNLRNIIVEIPSGVTISRISFTICFLKLSYCLAKYVDIFHMPSLCEDQHPV